MTRIFCMAAAGPQFEDAMPALGPAVAVLACSLVLFIAVRWLKKKLRKPEVPIVGGFTLADLRQLVRDGKMTPDEFERAKSKILEGHKRANDVKPPAETSSVKAAKIEDRG